MPRQLFLFSPINDFVAQDVIRQLMDLDRENNEEITIFINSPGGSVISMFAITDIMSVITSKIRTVIIGQAASAAAVIAAMGDTRLITEESRVMIHEAWGGAFGSISEIEEQAKEMRILQDKILKLLAKGTGKTTQELDNMIRKTNKFLNAKEARTKGFVDSIIKPNSAQVLKLSEGINGDGYEINYKEEGFSEVQLLKTGFVNNDDYNGLEITETILNKLKDNFDSNVRGIDIALDYTHENEAGERPAACWIKKLEVRDADNGHALFAQTEFTPKGREIVKAKEYKYASADFVIDYVSESGEHFPYVLRGGTLTNRPVVKEMNPIKLSENKSKPKELDTMELKEIMASLKAEHGIDVTELQSSLEASHSEVKALQDKIAELNKLPVEKENEIKALKDQLLEITNDANKKEKATAFNSLVASGKVVPAQEVRILGMFATAKDIEEFYSEAPEVMKTKADGEGDGGANGLTETETNLVSKGILTKESILENRKLS